MLIVKYSPNPSLSGSSKPTNSSHPPLCLSILITSSTLHARGTWIQPFEVTHELAGRFSQITRQHDRHCHELVPAAFSLQVGHPFAGQSEGLPPLCGRRNVHHHWAIQGLYLDRCA